MVNTSALYYFSPTGGTKKVGETFCKAIAENTVSVDLGRKDIGVDTLESDVVVVAAPVFGGRIPAIVTEKINLLSGVGKRAVTLVVYGNRAYEDALLELNDAMKARGFQIVGSGAFIARHSVVPEVGKDRPDAQDIEEIRAFAKKVLEKVKSAATAEVVIPGNRPYKAAMQIPAQPISLSSCNLCGKCARACPMDSISIENDAAVTNPGTCILCMACVAACPQKARILPPPLQERMDQMLGALKAIRKENEVFL